MEGCFFFLHIFLNLQVFFPLPLTLFLFIGLCLITLSDPAGAAHISPLLFLFILGFQDEL